MPTSSRRLAVSAATAVALVAVTALPLAASDNWPSFRGNGADGAGTGSPPATDKNVLVAFFGSEGLHAYDLDGNPLWNRQFGGLDSGPYDFPTYEWGFASSPIVHEGRVIVQADILSQSFVAVLDAATGEDVWRKAKEEVATWSTPAVFRRADGREQVVLNGYRHIGGYDLDTGEELWRLEGGGDIPVPTPIRAGDGPILITNAHGRLKPIYAIHPDAAGTLDPDHDAMVWFHERLGNYMQTPLVVGELAYFCYDNGVVTVVDWTTGERLTQKRLGRGASGFSASAVAAGGRIYFNSEVGDVYVIEPGAELNEIAVNELGETLMATPAISDGVIYFRARRHLVAVGSGS